MSPRNIKKHRSSTLCTPMCMPKPETSSSRPCLESLDIPDHLIQQMEPPKFCTAKLQPRKSSQSISSTCSCNKNDLSAIHTCTDSNNVVEVQNCRKSKKEHKHCCRKSYVKIKKDDSRYRMSMHTKPCCTNYYSSKELDLPESCNKSPTTSLTSCISIATSIDYQPSKCSNSQTTECCELDLQRGPHIIKIQLMPPQNNKTSSTHLQNSRSESVSKESQTNMKKASNLSWGRSDQFYSTTDAKPVSSVHISAKPTCSKLNQTESMPNVDYGGRYCADNGGTEEYNQVKSAVSEHGTCAACARVRIDTNANQIPSTGTDPILIPSNSKLKKNCANGCNYGTEGTENAVISTNTEHTGKASSDTESKMASQFEAYKDCRCSLPPTYNEFGCTGKISGNCNCTG